MKVSSTQRPRISKFTHLSGILIPLLFAFGNFNVIAQTTPTLQPTPQATPINAKPTPTSTMRFYDEVQSDDCEDVPGKIVIVFRPVSTDQDRTRVGSALGTWNSFRFRTDSILVNLNNGLSVERAIKIAKSDPAVKNAHPFRVFSKKHLRQINDLDMKMAQFQKYLQARQNELIVTPTIQATPPETTVNATPSVVSGRYQLHCYVPEEIKTAPLLGDLPLDQKLGLTIVMKVDQKALDKEEANMNSSGYRSNLSPEEFADKFGPSKEDYQKVIDYFTSHGFELKTVFPNRSCILIWGTVDVVQKALKIKLHLYSRSDGKTFWAPDTEPSLDNELPISEIMGLDTHFKNTPKRPTADAPMPAPTVQSNTQENQ